MGLRVLILRPTHRQIKEDVGFLKALGVRVAVWEGFERKCPRYKRGDELIVRLHDEANLTAEVLCQICDEAKGCPYKAQFQTAAQVIIAPVDYLWTGYIERLNPDVVIIDEPADRWLELPKLSKEDLEKARKWFRFHKKFTLGTGRFTVKDFRRGVARTAAQILKERIKEGASVDELVEEMKAHIRFDIIKLAEYLRLYRVYRRHQKYVVPYLFPAFDLVREGRLVIYADACYNEKYKVLLEASRERYELEREVKAPPLNIIEVEAPGPPKGRVIRVNPGAWYPKQTVEGSKPTLAWYITRLARQYKAEKVGVISYKDVVGDFVSALERALPGVKVEGLHFFNLKSSNAMWGAGTGFVVGTAVINVGEFKELARALLPHVNLSFEVEKLPGGGYRYKDPRVEALRRFLEDCEQYNAIHRFRPLQQKVTVFVFGRVPDRVYRELPVEEVPVERMLGPRGFYVVLQDLRRELEARGEVRLSEFIEAEARKLGRRRAVVWAWAMDAANYLWREGVARAEERPRGGRGRPPLYLVRVKKGGA